MHYLIFPLLAFLCSCSPQQGERSEKLRHWMKPNGRIKVLCTIAMITDMVNMIGGEEIDTTTLISGGLDPHSYQLVKGDDEKLLAADIVFFNGLGLEHGPSLHQHLVENKKAVSFGDHLLENPGAVYNVDGLPDPHIWMDIVLWSQGIDPVVAALSKQRPEKTAFFKERGDFVRHLLLEQDREIRALVHSLPPEKRYLVTSHDAFHYFARSYLATEEEQKNNTWQKRCAAPEGLAPDSMLSVNDIREIISHLKEYSIEVVFTESNINQDSIRKIVSAAQEEQIPVRIANCSLYSDAMGVPGSESDTYIKMIKHNAACIVEQLQ